MIDALGTLTPTSITVVATRIDSWPSANARMVSSLAAPRHAAVQQAARRSPKVCARWAWRSSAAASSDLSELSISGHTQ